MNAELAALIGAAETEAAYPVPLRVLSARAWAALAAGDDALQCIGLFVADERVHAVFADEDGLVFVAGSLDDGTYPALSPGFPGLAWFERLACDLTGAVAVGTTDTRPAIAHGQAGTDAAWPRFIEPAGDGDYQIGEGPVSGMIARPAHRRITLSGDLSLIHI